METTFDLNIVMNEQRFFYWMFSSGFLFEHLRFREDGTSFSKLQYLFVSKDSQFSCTNHVHPQAFATNSYCLLVRDVFIRFSSTIKISSSDWLMLGSHMLLHWIYLEVTTHVYVLIAGSVLNFFSITLWVSLFVFSNMFIIFYLHITYITSN